MAFKLQRKEYQEKETRTASAGHHVFATGNTSLCLSEFCQCNSTLHGCISSIAFWAGLHMTNSGSTITSLSERWCIHCNIASSRWKYSKAWWLCTQRLTTVHLHKCSPRSPSGYLRLSRCCQMKTVGLLCFCGWLCHWMDSTAFTPCINCSWWACVILGCHVFRPRLKCWNVQCERAINCEGNVVHADGNLGVSIESNQTNVPPNIFQNFLSFFTFIHVWKKSDWKHGLWKHADHQNMVLAWDPVNFVNFCSDFHGVFFPLHSNFWNILSWDNFSELQIVMPCKKKHIWFWRFHCF